jgi:GT2 family glycosyltransferase
MSEVDVTVLMPVYNGGRDLADAVQSILHQSLRNFQFLIINDGSSDDSSQRLNEFARRDSRIMLIERENRGLVSTLNEGLEKARGELIARMDADDIALPQRLQRQVDFLKAAPEVVCAGSFIENIDDRGRSLGYRLNLPEGDGEVQKQLLRGHTVICHPSAMYRRNVALSAGLYREDYFLAEDLDLWLRMGELGQLAIIPEVLLRYRQHHMSLSSASHLRQLDAMKRACEDAWRRRGAAAKFETKPWRPMNNVEKRRRMLEMGWRGFHRGDMFMGIDYACRALRLRPTSLDGWRLLYCCLAKKPSNRARDHV